MANTYGILTVVLFCQMAWIFLYIINKFPLLVQPNILVISGFLLYFGVGWLFKLILPPSSSMRKTLNPNIIQRGSLYYVCCVFSWTCVIDMIFYLEVVGVVDGFVGFYLKTGEPYFASTFGKYALLFDCIWTFPLYLRIIYCIDNKKDCRNVVLFYCGTLIVSVFSVLLGGFGGAYGSNIHPSSWLNIFYVVFPYFFLIHFINQPRNYNHRCTYQPQLKHKYLRIVLTISYLLLTAFAFIRGLAALGSPFPMAFHYAESIEPYIAHPDKFGSIFVLFLLFVGTLVQAMLLYGLYFSGMEWMTDLSIVYTAMTSYGSIVHILSQFDSTMLVKYQPPDGAQGLVIVGNLLLPFATIMTCALCFVEPDFFRKANKAR